MPDAPSPAPPPDRPDANRRRWLRVLSRVDEAALARALAAEPDLPAYSLLRRPEVGMVMVRGRAGGTGAPFNLGEMTVARCSVRLACGIVGHAYLAGRDRRRAELAALLDALLQDADRGPRLMASLIEPEERAQAEARATASRKAAATRVDFFAMVRMG